ncbi:ribosomal RNA methyltransferase [Thalassoporum mexicanum PCC 7367]|uniref:16S rRNA methyltransferase n=1 Tax=Thalassoporum mexicanum TaxID=3457544 RepID=UPI00029FB288|nr:16S rRNA methyltransferase [Pseudanabaena sp. PCC 7367]AFY69329.1 ribosomal RNA methyltransferase [Pseudanabaena sp. PCC 7367]
MSESATPEQIEHLDRLIASVLQSSKYKTIAPDLIQQIGIQELAKQPKLKEAIKATKNKLHQVGGAYLSYGTKYPKWLAELESTQGDRAAFLATCQRIMGFHASTKERLSILDRIYAETMGTIAPINSVLDLACGFNPLAIPWMPLAADMQYYACDIYGDMIGFINGFMAIAGISGNAWAQSISNTCPEQEVDLALILKTIPCLEQVDKGAGTRLLERIRAKHMLVSFPARSLSGKNKGMVANYEQRFYELIGDRAWQVQRFGFDSELLFMVSK